MAKPVFTWKVDSQATVSHEFNARVVQFGDGYEQRQRRFLKPKMQKWTVEKTALKKEIEAIQAFLDARGGVESFLWTPPDGKALLVVADKYSVKNIGGRAWVLSCEFREVMA
ncbi:phage tail protein [Neisseria weixii]|uniref:phage tail protein n=1 Tax=Neisseria weixii TaxID=1853276 RepID=UPI0035A09B66